MPLPPELQQLEDLRASLEQHSHQVGHLYDYLDRGRPNSEQQAQAWQTIESSKQAAARAEKDLAAQIARLRSTQPRMLQMWTELHVAVCERIIGSTAPTPDDPVSDQAIRRNLAQETKEAWHTLAKAGSTPPSVNGYFLRGYETELKKIMAETFPP